MQRGEWTAARVAMVLSGAVAATFVTDTTAREAAPVLTRARPGGDRKEPAREDDGAPAPHPLLGTLVDTHSPARVPLDDTTPTQARFDDLLRDPVMGSVHATDARLLGLVRALVARHPLARVEVVSGYRSPRLNEALRKKGHHVASHSQHSLGHALDLRVIPDGASAPLDPVSLAAEIRGLGWGGGVGVYRKADDRFVHADVGPRRAWNGE